MLHILQKTFPLFLFAWLLLVGLSGCGAYSGIAGVPPVTPREFLQQQHWIKVEAGRFSFIWSQPSSTLIVYFVGLFTMYAGYTLLHHRNNQQARLWWGIGLLFSGLGALLAGTSYQAFGYEIKCSGRESCTWTSWWEIVYLWLSVPAMNAFLVATAYTSASAKPKTESCDMRCSTRWGIASCSCIVPRMLFSLGYRLSVWHWYRLPVCFSYCACTEAAMLNTKTTGTGCC
ncbi:MAG: hypothetical protein IPH78_15165 [Bacteroidetes bacterium]|nr:hypothetical protein [Bacteroidota bacterium]